jgi:thiosulfate reductase/polysulfide reductase chain A
LAYDAIVTGDPYPVRAYLCFRHDPIMAMPDPEALKKKWEKLDLLVSITFSWSDTAWHSDVVLPLSTYLARESIIAGKSGLKPQFFVRKRSQEPTFDSRAEWEILCGLAKRLGVDALAFDSIEDIWNYQLKDTGVTIEDFDAKGFVELADKPLYRPMSEVTLPTAKGQTGRLKAFVTECVHPEALFMVHGFGHKLPAESRAFGKGAADNELMPGGLEFWDKGGGCLSMQEHFVGVRKI